jgi:hypothetical protein
MAYITKTITKQEKLLVITRVHWIYMIQGLFWLFFLAGLGIALDYYLYAHAGMHALNFKVDVFWLRFTPENTPIPWIFIGAGFAAFWPFMLTYVATEIGLTNERIIYKKGLFFIQIEQFDLDDIRAENIIHGWFGWLFSYGRIQLDCRFVDDVFLPAIPNPYRLVKASHTARMKHPKINYSRDDLDRNLEDIEERRQAAEQKNKIHRLKMHLKARFKKSATKDIK